MKPCRKKIRRASRGLTLIEVMVTIAIFLVMATFMFVIVQVVVRDWTRGERRRVLFEKAAGAVNMLANDIQLALTQEPPGATEVKVRFIGDYDPGTQNQRLMFVRAFEYGPERALTFNAGDGEPNALGFQAAVDPDDPDQKPVPKQVKNKGNVDGDAFDGLKVGDFRALGGMAAVGYFVRNEILYRAIRAPVPQALTPMLQPARAQAIATDVLYFDLSYWGQETQSWDEPKNRNDAGGPEKIWDSTRGIEASPLNRFFLHRGRISLNDPEDDVFPEKVRVTITVDSPLPRCTWTKLQDEIDDHTLMLYVDDTRGFPDGGEEAFIKIDDEWMQVKKKTQDTLAIAKRGVRGTRANGHKAGAVVRTGHTFRRTIYIPNFRCDFTPDEAYFARKAGSATGKRLAQ